MIILRVIAILGFIGVVALVASFLVAASIIVLWPWPPERGRYDVAHPDYAAYTARFAELRRSLIAGAPWVVIDFEPLNSGDWRTACLFGGSTDPYSRLRALGATFSDADHRRLTEQYGIFQGEGLFDLPEGLVALIDGAGRAQLILFDRFGLSRQESFQHCVTRPATQMAVKPWPSLSPPVRSAKRV